MGWVPFRLLMTRHLCRGLQARGLRSEHGARGQNRVQDKSKCDGDEETGGAEIEPIDVAHCTTSAHEQAQRIGGYGQDHAPEPLRGEEKRHPQAVEAVNRTDDAEVFGTEADDLVVVAEQTHPQSWNHCDDQPDRCTAARDYRTSDPGNSASAAILLGAPVSADQGHDRRAKAERQWEEDVLETSAHRVADRRLAAEMPGDAGED